ncbi:hypothetical protein DPM19_30490 [Actinomadura craniellae]|uniref:Uncharacterized protein n=1 Tax=Actinomadura craniellae TaxID=2231787 RepID=A0A365GWZ7_9ACTN|nr:hypothetical protein [Actinomadura craniellae]RAY11355.1 hypothetical protein DPM19_30490 [Actinomadura craniellae]
MNTTRPSAYDQRMLKIMNDPRARAPIATRARRRSLVLVSVLLSVATLAIFVLARGPVLLLLALAVLLPAWCVVTGMLNAATRGLLELRARVLDERQLAERGRVCTLAHRASLGLQLAALAISGVHLQSAANPSAGPVVGLMVVVLMAHWLLPLWTAAFTARDEPEPDDE